MKIKSLAEIMEEMRRRYKRRPKERDKWRMLGGRDERGFTDFFFYGPKEGLWHVKGESKSPYELLGAGTRFSARKIDDEIQELMEQGRPLPFGIMSPHPRRKDTAVIAAGIGRYPESVRPIKGLLSGKQRELDAELRRRVEELRRKHGLDVGYR